MCVRANQRSWVTLCAACWSLCVNANTSSETGDGIGTEEGGSLEKIMRYGKAIVLYSIVCQPYFSWAARTIFQASSSEHTPIAFVDRIRLGFLAFLAQRTSMFVRQTWKLLQLKFSKIKCVRGEIYLRLHFRRLTTIWVRIEFHNHLFRNLLTEI